jgi:hypothetical protein
MNVIIQKLNGLWHLNVGSCQIRSPFLETQDRGLVVAYARRIYPGAKIFERSGPSVRARFHPRMEVGHSEQNLNVTRRSVGDGRLTVFFH